MALDDLSSFPIDTGLNPAPGAVAWAAGTWAEMTLGAAMDISIIGVRFQVTEVPPINTTREYLWEIGTGASGAEVVKVQIPYSVRNGDTVTPSGYYLTTSHSVFLPEPFTVPANTRIAVRCYSSTGAANTQSGVKLFIKGGNEAFYNISDPMGMSGMFGT